MLIPIPLFHSHHFTFIIIFLALLLQGKARLATQVESKDKTKQKVKMRGKTEAYFVALLSGLPLFCSSALSPRRSGALFFTLRVLFLSQLSSLARFWLVWISCSLPLPPKKRAGGVREGGSMKKRELARTLRSGAHFLLLPGIGGITVLRTPLI